MDQLKLKTKVRRANQQIRHLQVYILSNPVKHTTAIYSVGAGGWTVDGVESEPMG